MPHFGDYENEIYLNGLRDIVPKLPVNFELLEQKAQAAMPDPFCLICRAGVGMSSRNATMLTPSTTGVLFRA